MLLGHCKNNKYPPLYYNVPYKYCILVLIIYQPYIKGVINNLHTCIHHPICLTPPYTPPKFSHPFCVDRQVYAIDVD